MLAMFNLGLNLIVVFDLRADLGRAPDAQLARAATDRRDAGDSVHRGGDAAVVTVRVFPGHAADLGGSDPGPVLRSPVIVPVTTVQRYLSPALVKVYMMNPLAVVAPAVPSRDDQPRHPVGDRIAGRRREIARAHRYRGRRFVLGLRVFNRTAPHVAEDL